MDRQRMDAALELVRQCRVDHAVALEPGLSPERLRYNIKTKVRFTARAMPGMALVQMGFILDVQALRGKSRNQLGRYDVLHSHGQARSGRGWLGDNKTLGVLLGRTDLPAVKS